MSLTNYLNFFSKSTNQHGVHSPFVYSLVTKCFYNKKKNHEYKQIKELCSKKHLSSQHAELIFRIGRYLNIKNTLILANNPLLASKILTLANPQIYTATSLSVLKNKIALDLIYLDHFNLQDFEQETELLIKNTHNNSLLLIRNIHESKTTQSHWNLLKDHPKVTVTIDTFAFGFVFFRSEQAKEHFVIRL